jgi:hypothetical protein
MNRNLADYFFRTSLVVLVLACAKGCSAAVLSAIANNNVTDLTNALAQCNLPISLTVRNPSP